MRTVLALLLVSAANNCGGKYADLPFSPATPSAAPDPSKLGPYPVGVTTYESIFDMTADSIVEAPETPQVRTDQYGQPRHLVTEVWYPAVESARGQPGKIYNVVDLATDTEKQQIQQSGVQVPLLRTTAVENAQPRLEDAPYPLVIFSHGQYGIRWQTTFFTIALASHGYIVVSPDHPGNTLQDELSLKATSSGSLGGSIFLNYFQRQVDVQYLITYFSGLAGSDFLHGMVDKDHVGVTGHSFGALTALRVAEYDPRVKAIVPMAPTSMAEALPDLPQGYSTSFVLQTPALIEGSGTDNTLPFTCNAADAYSQLGVPRGLVDVVAGGHFTFSDLCKFNLEQVVNAIQFLGAGNVISDGCGPTNTPASVAEPIVNNYAVGFLNWQLRGSTGSRKYLTQESGDALAPATPHLNQACTGCTDQNSCDPGQACDPGPGHWCSCDSPASTPGTCRWVDFQSDL
jgi:predicted dienelactone hydrolase